MGGESGGGAAGNAGCREDAGRRYWILLLLDRGRGVVVGLTYSAGMVVVVKQKLKVLICWSNVLCI